MRTFNGSSEDGSPGWGDPDQDYSGIDTEHQVMFCERGDTINFLLLNFMKFGKMNLTNRP